MPDQPYRESVANALTKATSIAPPEWQDASNWRYGALPPPSGEALDMSLDPLSALGKQYGGTIKNLLLKHLMDSLLPKVGLPTTVDDFVHKPWLQGIVNRALGTPKP